MKFYYFYLIFIKFLVNLSLLKNIFLLLIVVVDIFSSLVYVYTTIKNKHNKN